MPPDFVGGAGEPRIHLYPLYDWNPVLDADGGNGPLDRDHDKASGEPIHDREGDGFNRVFFVIAPVDSQEVRGLSFRSPPGV